ncbi:MAG: dTMP kinase [Desulfovibrio sp.]|nr:dTMP kinase [Desulfovibrio sp.]
MFVTFEGIDGAGKTTVLTMLADKYRALGKNVLVTREPGGSTLGVQLRAFLLDSKTHSLDPRAELFLFLADRAQHVATSIKPALETGTLVFCDRFMDSTFAYQGGGRGLDLEQLLSLNNAACNGLIPDVTFLLDLSIETARARLEKRAHDADPEKETRFDRYATSFHERVREKYLALANRFRERFHILDAEKSSSDLVNEAKALLDARLAHDS